MSLNETTRRNGTGSNERTAFSLSPIPSMSQQRLDTGFHDLAIYFAGATHFMEFCKNLGVTACKVGVTGCRDVGARIEDLRRKRYASIVKTPDQPLVEAISIKNGYEWFKMPVTATHLGGVSLPEQICIENGHIILRVPTRVTVDMVNRAVHGLLKPRSLQAYLRTEEGRERLRLAGHQADLWFYTRYELMTVEARLSAAEELYLIRPRKELGALIDVLARFQF